MFNFNSFINFVRNFFFGSETVVTETVEVTETVVTETITETITETVVTETETETAAALQVSDLLGKDVLDEVARYEYGAWIQKLVPVDIPRSTQMLGTGENLPGWPAWLEDEPVFQAVLTACNATPADLQAGILPEKTYKAIRQKGLSARGRQEFVKAVKKVRLPQSPKVMGILKACGASEDSLKAFENRGAKAQNVTYYISNEALPLVQIGNWGQGFYRSCQAWDQRNPRHCHPHPVALKCFAHLEDPSVFVAWAGSPQEMTTRVICRKMTVRKGWSNAGKKVLVMERWYGDAGYVAQLTEYLKTWAEAQGFLLGQSGGLPENAEGLAETQLFEAGPHMVSPYLDNGFAELENGRDITMLPVFTGSKVKVCSHFKLVGV